MAVIYLNYGPLDKTIHEIHGTMLPARVQLPHNGYIHTYDISMADNEHAYYTGESLPIIKDIQ